MNLPFDDADRNLLAPSAEDCKNGTTSDNYHQRWHYLFVMHSDHILPAPAPRYDAHGLKLISTNNDHLLVFMPKVHQDKWSPNPYMRYLWNSHFVCSTDNGTFDDVIIQKSRYLQVPSQPEVHQQMFGELIQGWLN